MDRKWPLPDPFQPSSTARLESFVLAKSSKIQPGNVVWDPFCQRGTFLIEAAKYWPMAWYYGTDTNMGHLEHCQMNAKSTCTVLHLQHTPTKGNAVQQLKEALLEENQSGVDKILTCLPPGRSFESYQALLSDWMQILHPSGAIAFLVDVADLTNLRQAVEHPGHSYRISFVRNPPFLWGKKQRSTLVMIDVREPENTGDISWPKIGMLDWEEKAIEAIKNNRASSEAMSPSETLQLWGQVRDQTIPWMIPATEKRTLRSKIRLPNGKLI